MKVLITGGAGFIGSWLSEALLDAGHSVSVMDDLSTGSVDNLARCMNRPGFRFLRDDIMVSGALEKEILDADCLIHLAAAVGVDLVVKDPVRTIMTNVKGSERVLSIAAQAKKRCILASTSEVYGKSTRSTFSENDGTSCTNDSCHATRHRYSRAWQNRVSLGMRNP